MRITFGLTLWFKPYSGPAFPKLVRFKHGMTFQWLILELIVYW